MRNYELLCVLPGTMTEDEVEPLVKQVEEIISQNGGENLKVEDMGKNRLAYPMKHIRYGYFRLFLFEAEKEKITGMREKISLIPQILRAMFSVYNPSKRKQSKINYVTDQSGFVTMTKDILAQKAAQDKSYSRPSGGSSEQEKESGGQPSEKEKKQEKTEPTEKKKVDLKDIDEQLDKILDSDIASV